MQQRIERVDVRVQPDDLVDAVHDDLHVEELGDQLSEELHGVLLAALVDHVEPEQFGVRGVNLLDHARLLVLVRMLVDERMPREEENENEQFDDDGIEGDERNEAVRETLEETVDVDVVHAADRSDLCVAEFRASGRFE